MKTTKCLISVMFVLACGFAAGGCTSGVPGPDGEPLVYLNDVWATAIEDDTGLDPLDGEVFAWSRIYAFEKDCKSDGWVTKEEAEIRFGGHKAETYASITREALFAFEEKELLNHLTHIRKMMRVALNEVGKEKILAATPPVADKGSD